MEPFSSPFFAIYWDSRSAVQIDSWNRSEILTFCWKSTTVYKIPKIISLGKTWAWKNKPNLKIKPMLTQKNEFILEASNFRFNCVDLTLLSPIPFSTVACWREKKKKSSELPRFRFILYGRRPSCFQRQTSQLTLTSSAIRRTRTYHLKFHPHTSKKLVWWMIALEWS